MTNDDRSNTDKSDLPLVLCGPLLRRVTTKHVTYTLVTSQPVQMKIDFLLDDQQSVSLSSQNVEEHTCCLKAGSKMMIHLVELPIDDDLPLDQWIGYQLYLKVEDGAETNHEETLQNVQSDWRSLTDLMPDLILPNKKTLGFMIKSKASPLVHGSCRKPHFPGRDGLVRVDEMLQQEDPEKWPAMLVLSGDQVYVDDVAGPMLVAIHSLIDRLGLPSESFEGGACDNSDELHDSKPHYYERESLLPVDKGSSDRARNALFTSIQKPVFTSANARNHLISLSEMMVMYLLVWSPVCWKIASMNQPSSLSLVQTQMFSRQKEDIDTFQQDLTKVSRVFANLPTAMIFDDHDVTDDWNLTTDWESSAYDQPFSKRIIGNALIAYLLFQGWGNDPEQFSDELMSRTQKALAELGTEEHDTLISELLKFPNWHYQWPTDPPLLVLDTRTHRWRSEVKRTNPSGLMDWESLTDLQQKLLGMDSVILVSAAPIFGVKLIEGIQKVFTWLGRPLMVDAENWMAHPGAANVLLNMFRHSRTPSHFTILSGDVHYSFVYEVQIRRRKNSPHIWQVTSSGIRNEFPRMLLEIFDRLNRWLYAPWSPLNWFTKRRRMRILPYRPKPAQPGERLVNAAGIGIIEFDENNTPVRMAQLCANGETIEFFPEAGHGSEMPGQ